MQTDNRPLIRQTALAQIGPYLLVAACLAVLLVFILLAQYAHPSSDDFCMASGVNEHGLMAQLWKHYLEWSGRYSSNALYAVYPIVFDLFDAYKFIPAIVVAALFFAMAFFLSTLFAVRLFSRPVLLSSLGFVSVYLLGMLSPASGLFWMAGAFTYQTANVLLLVVLGLMIRLADRQRQNEKPLLLLALLLPVVVIAVGANETSMLAITALALFGLVLKLRSGWATLWPWLVILLLSMLCFAVVYYSPGNEIRSADFALRHDFSRSIKGSLSVGLKTLWIWISNPVLIIATVLAPFAISRLLQRSGRPLTVPIWLIAALAMGTVVLPVVLQFPAWWSMGGWPPARTLDAIYFLFLLGWFLTGVAVTVRYACSVEMKAEQRSHSRYAAIAMLVLSVLFGVAVVRHDAFRMAKTDLLHHARPYHEYLNTRYQRIAQARENNQRHLVVADFQQTYPRTLYFNDIMYNPEHWRNVCYADYFGLDKIRRIRTAREPGQAPVTGLMIFFNNKNHSNTEYTR